MKTLLPLVLFVLAASFVSKPDSTTFDGYNVQLLGVNPSGSNYEWKWSVTNPDPGNGTGETLQDLSHWSIVLPDNVTQSNIVGAFYSLNGVTWHSLPAVIGVDPSNECYSGEVLKFDFGTNGEATTYFKLVVNEDYAQGSMQTNFKSGRRTGCYTSFAEGIGDGTGSGR